MNSLISKFSLHFSFKTTISFLLLLASFIMLFVPWIDVSVGENASDITLEQVLDGCSYSADNIASWYDGLSGRLTNYFDMPQDLSGSKIARWQVLDAYAGLKNGKMSLMESANLLWLLQRCNTVKFLHFGTAYPKNPSSWVSPRQDLSQSIMICQVGAALTVGLFIFATATFLFALVSLVMQNGKAYKAYIPYFICCVLSLTLTYVGTMNITNAPNQGFLIQSSLLINSVPCFRFLFRVTIAGILCVVFSGAGLLFSTLSGKDAGITYTSVSNGIGWSRHGCGNGINAEEVSQQSE